MGLKGKFEWHNSLRAGGGKAISFTLTCDNLFQGETFDCAIIGNDGLAQPMIFRQLKLKAKQSFQFNFDTVDWQWCNGDSFVILGKNDSIKQKWPLSLKTYAPGECPDCHGTNKCRKCSGKGFVNLRNYTIEQCDLCCGTGICQTCYVPRRNGCSTQYPNINEVSLSSGKTPRDRQIDGLRKNISDLKIKIEKTQWDMRMMQLKDTDRTNSNVYLSYNQLLHQYNIRMINLQSQLEQLENMN